MALDVAGFVLVSGGFEIIKRSVDVDTDGVAGAELTGASLLSVRLINVNLFVGIGGSFEDLDSDAATVPTINTADAVGFDVSSANLTLAIIKPSLADIALGLAVLVRPWARAACFGMAGLGLAYLALGTILTPWLWADPLGALVKVLPGIALALVTAAMLEER